MWGSPKTYYVLGDLGPPKLFYEKSIFPQSKTTSQKLHCHTIFLMIGFLLSQRQYAIKPRHIRHLLGTYTPNDEGVSLLEQIAADKGRFSNKSDHTLIWQCQPPRDPT
jgi:hypothetical protein